MKDSISSSENSNSENNKINTETIEKTDPNIPKDFSPVNYLDPSTEPSIVTLYKSKEWDSIIPTILDAIEHCKDETGYGDYPYFRIQNTINFLPKLNVESEILNEQLLKELHSRLPYYHQFSNWKRLYSLTKDGCQLKTLINKTEEYQNTILIVKDDENKFLVHMQVKHLNYLEIFMEQERHFYLVFLKKIEFMFIIQQELMKIIFMEIKNNLLLVVVMIIFH